MKTDWGYDISPLVNEKLAVFPGDQPFRRKVALDLKSGDHLTLSSLESTLHLGAHADAPSHYHAEGGSIEVRDLTLYFGWCEVLRWKEAQPPQSGRLGAENFPGFTPRTERVLIDTGSFPEPSKWRDDFLSLEPEWIAQLAASGVKLVGLDTPSVDPATSKTLPAHQSLYENDLAVLEGLLLKGVPEGVYFLSALPLKIEGADASPVRAALFRPEHMQSFF